MMDLMQAGLRIKRLRKQHKLTQEKLADRQCSDHLELLIEKVPYSKRENLAEIISTILPYLK